MYVLPFYCASYRNSSREISEFICTMTRARKKLTEIYWQNWQKFVDKLTEVCWPSWLKKLTKLTKLTVKLTKLTKVTKVNFFCWQFFKSKSMVHTLFLYFLKVYWQFYMFETGAVLFGAAFSANTQFGTTLFGEPSVWRYNIWRYTLWRTLSL